MNRNLLILVPFLLDCAGFAARTLAGNGDAYDIAAHGAVGDGKTVNTQAIQASIDACAAGGGGTLVVPKGEFVTGSLFLKPGVNVELRDGGVLRNSPDAADFPFVERRIEGMTRPSRRAMLNADQCDGLRITGPGTLDGNNPTLFADPAAAKFKADSIVSKFPQLCYIKDSSNVIVSNVKFERSAFWNLHFYRCHDVLVEKTSFRVDHKVRSPSSDGIDLDSCQNVTVRDCLFDVEDDCVCLKGSRGPHAWDDKDSPPTENIRVSGCTFVRGQGGVSFGTEATLIRNVTIENCHAKLDPKFGMLRFKIRPDTPGQTYENIVMRNITMDDSRGRVVMTRLDHGTKDVVKDPHRVIRNVTIENVTGSCESLGMLFGNDMTEVHDVMLRDIDIKTVSNDIGISDKIEHLTLDNVRVNGVVVATTRPTAP